MKKDISQLIQQYKSCPTEKAEYIINGKKYTVIRHFTGDRDINQVVLELAINRANREFGIN